MIKVISITEPPKTKYEHPWDIFQLVLDSGNGVPYRADMSRVSYEVFKLEQELLSKGVDKKLLYKYHDAVRNEAEYDSQDF